MSKSFINLAIGGVLLIYVIYSLLSQQKSPPPPSPTIDRPQKASLAAKKPPVLDMEPPKSLQTAENKAMRKVTARFKAGDFGTALKIARSQLDDQQYSTGYKSWLKRQLPAMLTSYAWSIIHQGDCEKGVKLLQESLAYKPLSQTSKGLAYCYFKEKKWDLAEEHYLQYTKTEKNDASMLLIYAEVLESTARFEEAQMALEQALTAMDDSHKKDDIKKRLSSMKAKTIESHLQATFASENFLISYRAQDHEAIITGAAEILEAALFEFVENNAMPQPKEPIEILFYPAQSFGHLVSYGPKWAKGIYDGRIRVQIKKDLLQNPHDLSGLKRLLRHELIHALLSEKIDRRELPYWFNEGLAMFFECELGCKKRQGAVQNKAFMKKDFFLKRFTSLNAGEASILYRQSLYMVQSLRLLLGGGEDPLRQIVASLNPRSRLDSDSLLMAAGVSFNDLYSYAKESWDKK